MVFFKLFSVNKNMGVGVFVTVKVPDDKKDEFLKVMAVDVVESRKEEGCVSFDLCDQGEGVYSFYEVYKDANAATHHKTLPHYLGWAECAARRPQSRTADRATECSCAARQVQEGQHGDGRCLADGRQVHHVRVLRRGESGRVSSVVRTSLE